MSVSQLQDHKWPVVSVPNGAGGAVKTFKQEMEWLAGFEEIVLAFDMDGPGQEAARECAAVLPPGKAKIAHLPAKDANECLKLGLGKELISSLWNAHPYRPDGIVEAATLLERAMEPVKLGLDWPWPTLTRYTYGRRRREIYGFGAGTGCGKTTTFKEIIRHILTNEALPVGLLFLEEPPHHTLKTIAGLIDGVRYHVPGVEYDPEKLRATLDQISQRVFLYDHFGAMGWDGIKEKIRFMAHGLGIKDIFLDHLTALAASVDDDERKAIDKIMAELSALAQELDITIYYISHLTTPEGKPHEEGGRVKEKDFRGSRSIAFWSHFLFGLERDKQDREGITTFRVLKDRYTGDANGITFGLRYDRNSGRMHECALPDNDDGDEQPRSKREIEPAF